MRVATLSIDGTNDRALVVDDRIVGRLVLIAHSCNRYYLTECTQFSHLTESNPPYYGATLKLWIQAIKAQLTNHS